MGLLTEYSKMVTSLSTAIGEESFYSGVVGKIFFTVILHRMKMAVNTNLEKNRLNSGQKDPVQTRYS